MISLRFAKIGKKKMPYFRLIAVDKQKDPWGAFLEILGHYNPRTKELKIELERVKYWLSKGAEATKTVHNLFITHKIIEGKKLNVTSINKRKRNKMDAKDKANKAAEAKTAEANATPAETPAAAPVETSPAKETPAEPKAEVTPKQ